MLTAAQVRRVVADIRSEPDRLLTSTEEKILTRAYASGIETVDCRDVLIWRNIGLAHKAASRFVNPEHREDAVACGLQGLVSALDKFDPDHGTKFSTYAWQFICQRIRRYATSQQDVIRMPEHRVYLIYRMRKAWAVLSVDLGRNPTLPELSVFMNEPEDVLRDAHGESLLRVESLNDDSKPFSDVSVPDNCAAWLHDMDSEILNGALLRIDNDTRCMIVRHFGLDGRTPETLTAIGQTYGMSKQAVDSRMQTAYKKLRTIL